MLDIDLSLLTCYTLIRRRDERYRRERTNEAETPKCEHFDSSRRGLSVRPIARMTRSRRGGSMWAMHFMEAECDPFIGELLRLVAEVDSAHTTERRYHTQYVAALDMAFCDCPAGLLAHACWHAGQSIAYGRSAAEAYSPAGCAAPRQENYRNWLDGDTTVDVACDC